MFALLRDGFAGDLIILLLVSILLGSLGASAIAAAVDNYFGDTVNELIGDYGEFDVIIHVREEVQGCRWPGDGADSRGEASRGRLQEGLDRCRTS